MKRTTVESNTGIRWRFTSKLEDLDFADDIALVSPNYQQLQIKATKLSQFAAQTGFKINKKKSEVLRINSNSNNRIQMGEQQLNEVDKYTYLGAIVSKQGGGGDDIINKIHKARISFMKLNRIWSSHIYTLPTKLRLFNTLVKSVLLYGCETWTVNQSDELKLDTFQFKCLRRILKIRWPYIVKNNVILQKTNSKKISTEIMSRRWKWLGHIMLMDQKKKTATLH
ncbi:uncharacterized protein LOC117113048 [Anneissia japonica]|uniref:uncharacterized protein LOC117113048 n=1 Tax=Anneissia japonica TaxID=1529436 RepID=UPI001425589A|nr:uncharacterized protein LOC117113048 [Anneissia japonica]